MKNDPYGFGSAPDLNKQKKENKVKNTKKEFVIAQEMSKITSKRVIVVVLTMLFSVPFFYVTSYITEPNSHNFGLSLIHELGPSTEGGRIVFQDTIPFPNPRSLLI